MCRDPEWTVIDEDHAAGEFTMKLSGWSKERRFVVLRERIRETKAAVGRTLIEVPGYTFRVWVTSRSEGALELWRDYNGRACVEQRIEELKHDLAADGFCLQPFFATESAFLAVLFTFNLLSLYQHQVTPGQRIGSPEHCAWQCSCVERYWESWGGTWWSSSRRRGADCANTNRWWKRRWTGSSALRRS